MKHQEKQDVRHRELDTLLKFNALINSSLNILDVLNYAMEWAEEFMNAEASTVYELDEETKELFVRIARGEKKEPVKNIKLSLGEGIAGSVANTCQPIVIQDVSKENAFSDKFDRKTGFKTRSMICVPLIIRDKPIGALQVLNKKSGQAFSNEDLELLTSMSQQIAVAIDNARLYDRLQRSFELTARELKETQEKLIRSERLAAMGHLVQGVAHEIRNPVTTIGGFAERLKKELREESRLQTYIRIILEESERLENLVREVHEFANVLSAVLTLDDIKPVLDQVITRAKDLTKLQGVDLRIRVDEHLPLTRMAASQLTIALHNIIENSLESMPQGGELTLEVKHETNQILIRIIDTGRGIPEEDLASVYDPFVTSKTRGAGLGLTMVHQIVMNHDGEIDIQSHKGAGTTVNLRLPVKR